MVEADPAVISAGPGYPWVYGVAATKALLGHTVVYKAGGASHPYDCSLYYANGVLMSCPEGLHFDPRKNICNWPEKVDCESITDHSANLGVCTNYLGFPVPC